MALRTGGCIIARHSEAKCPACGTAAKSTLKFLRDVISAQGHFAQMLCSYCFISTPLGEWLAASLSEPKEKGCDPAGPKGPVQPMSEEDHLSNHILSAMHIMGLNVEEPGLLETPRRVAKFLMEFSQPCDLKTLLKSFSIEEHKDGGLPMVIVRDIPVEALCEHHFASFFGTVDIGYIPTNKVVGLSKFVRLTRAAGHRRPTMQERLTNDIVEAIEEVLQPKGVMAVMRCLHSCMIARGVTAHGVETVTSAIRGVYTTSSDARSEFLVLSRK